MLGHHSRMLQLVFALATRVYEPEESALPYGLDEMEMKSLACTACTTLVNKIDNMVNDGTTISSALNLVCQNMSSLLSVFCSALVDNYADILAAYISQGLTSTDICKTIRACK